MTASENRSIAIGGVGSSMSRSLVLWLASLGWNVALLSRSENTLSTIANEVKKAQSNNKSQVVYRTADAADQNDLKAALDWCVEQFNCKLDVLNYNAAHVTESNVIDLTPEDLEQDFRISGVGTLVAGQWFMKNARLDYLPEGEHPLYLVTGGILDKEPELVFSSLCAAKSASQTLSRLFRILPESFDIMDGMPLVSRRITDPFTSEHTDGFAPDVIIQRLFKPFFEGRERLQNGKESWVIERVL
ncbi:unnamed protein product [Penicillium olsonii]|uniref:Short-chain dehydrogenase n=1 Tax=Penicillium olsonii TaxID=99116 RepID=A0A9W4I1G4_PENOL|nr:unnamed protein product [Penicillium olsonii]CAG8233342.1 unnamed protein product [Penicillium olsonii]